MMELMIMNRLMTYLRDGKASVLSAALPSTCSLCGCENMSLICDACQQQFFASNFSSGSTSHTIRCKQCAINLPPLQESPICGHCLSNSPAFDRTLAACNYEAPYDQLVLTLKFGHQLPIANLFAHLISHSLLEQVQEKAEFRLPDFLCPVPLSQERLAERGFNQSLEMCKLLSLKLGIPIRQNFLIRTKHTLPQSSLNYQLRSKNVRNAFIINPHYIEQVEGKTIGIVDDVMTTGATLNEMAQLLKRFGASSVINFIFARTPAKSP